jgi:hypothetical protein
MATNQPVRDHEANQEPDEQDTKLERIVKKIVPPSHEVTDDDLKDPGGMTPDAPPTDNRS